MTRKEAIEVYNGIVNPKVIEAFQTLVPELKGNKDERIRKAIGVAICGTKATSILEANGSNLPEALDYLEKQKKQSFTHHEIDESLRDAVTHQMEDDGDVDDFVRRGIDDIVLKYAELGAQWQKEQKPVARENDFVSKPQTSVEILKHYLTWATSEEENCPYSWKELADAIRDGIKALEEQQPAEWSEEDKQKLNRIYEILGYAADDKGFLTSKRIIGDKEAIELQDFLKSLRPLKDCSSCAKHLEGYISGRSDAENKLLEQFGALVTPEDELHIKPRWKPSEEQIKQ